MVECEDVVVVADDEDDLLLKMLAIEEEWMSKIIVELKGEEQKVVADEDVEDVAVEIDVATEVNLFYDDDILFFR